MTRKETRSKLLALGVRAEFLPGGFLVGDEIWELGDVNLTAADLAGASLEGADLTGADLELANLSEADLTRAKLYHADLYRANLNGAKLIGANLKGAILTDVTWVTPNQMAGAAQLGDAIACPAVIAGLLSQLLNRTSKKRAKS
ncbi:MAG: hypothetical protein A2826_03205 [Candidatus Doudnabacteria bacterium RIFCSPHIGHO2_01_FULL_43_23]|uniref:Pentapeptide repeat-containing protein n=1 Tax=Candidatus Doudnabacteria bacterium RIFCSPHIGHO2_01_FULL_43_23 TaxID=1817822 RepID=A0A1F5NRX2_9BACT|nr:MAG: hypothetical protein A2826_03205 [Candidatus Doudnabacteria bacterium RIFCSPHIGHO2_01_FULL_43_23]